jgi:hypothetical protein
VIRNQSHEGPDRRNQQTVDGDSALGWRYQRVIQGARDDSTNDSDSDLLKGPCASSGEDSDGGGASEKSKDHISDN